MGDGAPSIRYVMLRTAGGRTPPADSGRPVRRPLLAAIGVNLAWHAVLFAVALTLPLLGGAAPAVVNLAACVVPLGVIAWLGWWRAPWLSGVLPRRPWTLAPVVVVIGAELVRGIEGSSAVLVTSAVVMLSVGVSEELYARGVMQELLRTMRPLALVATVGLLFGAGHVLSGLVFGRPADYIAFQVLHATVFGFIAAALRLHVVSIWPLALLHAGSNWLSVNSVGELPVWWEVCRLAALAGYGVVLARLSPGRLRAPSAPVPSGS